MCLCLMSQSLIFLIRGQKVIKCMTVLTQFKLREKHIAWLCYFQPDLIMIGVMNPVSLLWSQTLVIFV